MPTWSVEDTKLSVMSDVATTIAGIATFFAAIYAYKSFDSWEDRTKKQHILEQKLEALKDLSFNYHKVMGNMEHLLVMRQAEIDVTQDIHIRKNKGVTEAILIDSRKKLDGIKVEIGNALREFTISVSTYSNSYSFFSALHDIKKIEMYSDLKIKEFYIKTEKLLHPLGKGETIITSLSEYSAEGSHAVSTLYKELFDYKAS
jgi:hypothetical protein